ncbi:Uncharacterized protein APZ42_020712 [Daphnia magna]|uniref:Uncharacterized protein n=1 Tax=Daphnia magna TaxID=35525 RepID=A0A0P5A4P6_9CRUS|nr:Uncharacterized protein APZ42_020712 [Daphnia magna]
MVEIDRVKMTSNSSAAVKQEKRDDQEEIDLLAAKMVEANRAKMANLSSAATTLGQTGTNSNPLQSGVASASRMLPGTLLGYFSKNSAGVGAKEVVDAINKEKINSAAAVSIDLESAKGRFGWTDSSVHIPYIYRRDEKKFCSVRVLEQCIIKMFANVLRPELSGCVSIQSFYVSEIESRLLNEINVKHCDWQYGRELFTVRDLIINLDDALELIQFLQTCKEKLVRKSCDPQDRCGFFRIGGESVVPYTVISGTKYVPLFYFEGETGNLDRRAIQITGWDLAYLKLCCKVQGIRNELFSNDSYSAVSVEDIKQQFPAQTDLQLYWPSRSSLDVPSNGASGASNAGINMWIHKPSGSPPPLPVNSNTTAVTMQASSVIQKNPAASAVAAATRLPSTSSSSALLHQASGIVPPSRPAVIPPTCTSSNLYNGWSSMNSYASVHQQMQQQQSASNTNSSSSSSAAAASAHLATVLQSQSAAARAQAAAVSAMLMPSMPVHHSSMGQAFNMMQYAQAVAGMMQQQQSQQQAQSHRNQAPPPPPSQAHASASSTLDNLLRANGIHTDHHRLPHGSSSNAAMNHSAYSSSQSPLTGAVPGSSPHSRSSTGASPRPGLPVPSSSLVHSSLTSSSSSSSTPKPPPPPLIPVNGSHPLFSSMPNNSSMASQGSSRLHQASSESNPHGLSRSYHQSQYEIGQRHHPQMHHQLLQQQQQSQQPPPFKLQLYQIENQTVPCVNSRQYVYNNLMIALPDMAAYLFPHLGHQTCKQVLQDGLGVTLYEANPQQLQVLKSAGKVSSVSSLAGEKISLVNVRDVVQYMPQIRYMMSRLDGGAELSHAHSSKRQRVS